MTGDITTFWGIATMKDIFPRWNGAIGEYPGDTMRHHRFFIKSVNAVPLCIFRPGVKPALCQFSLYHTVPKRGHAVNRRGRSHLSSMGLTTERTPPAPLFQPRRPARK